MDTFEKEDKYIQAQQRVDDEKGFYWNIAAYIIVVPFLAGLNYWINEWKFPWFLFSALGWGIGVFFHAVKTFRWFPFLGKNWEDRKIKEFMAKEDENQRNWE